LAVLELLFWVMRRLVGWNARYNRALFLGKKTLYLKPATRLLGLALTLSLGWSEMGSRAEAQAPQPRIDVVVVSGEGGVNSLLGRVSQDPVVRIEDQNHQPVSGAIVTFNLPISGTSGEFGNGIKNLNVVTGADGLAAARGLRTNDVPGRFQILITASYRGMTARGLINQTNQGTPIAKRHGGRGKLVAILAIAGAAAAGGAVAATHIGGSSSTSAPSAPTPIGITPGTPTVTHP
jgi:hypothetical protein